MKHFWMYPLLALLLTATQAQTPLDPTVEITAGQPSGDVSVDRAATVDIVVENTSPGTGSPLDPPMQVTMSTSGIPSGWNVAMDPGAFELASGETQTVVMTVSVTAGAAQGDGSVTVRALIRSGPPGQISASGEDTTTITFRHDPSTTREVVEAIGPWFWFILAATFIGAGLASYFGYDLFRKRIALHADVTELRVEPGSTVAFPITVENRSRRPRSTVFHVDGPGDGWAAFMAVPELDMDANSSQELNLMVTAPSTAKPGEKRTLTVSADNGSDGNAAAIAVRCLVDAG